MKALKSSKKKRYFEISLRDDLAQLIFRGLAKSGEIKTQRDLSEASGYRDSYVSRLANAATNCKLSAVARVLVPLGIIPMLVDQSEWKTLKDKAENAERAKTMITKDVIVRDILGSLDNAIIQQGSYILTTGIRIEDRAHWESGGSTTSIGTEARSYRAPRFTDHMGGPYAVLTTQKHRV